MTMYKRLLLINKKNLSPQERKYLKFGLQMMPLLNRDESELTESDIRFLMQQSRFQTSYSDVLWVLGVVTDFSVNTLIQRMYPEITAKADAIKLQKKQALMKRIERAERELADKKAEVELLLRRGSLATAKKAGIKHV